MGEEKQPRKASRVRHTRAIGQNRSKQPRKILNKRRLMKIFSVHSLLNELESLTQIKFSGKQGQMHSEVTKTQRKALKAFSISLDS
ncbi:MAG: hypothetical protein NTZ74_07925 [Chloroflexi bacterium]|nr:hypothetical protein [Chloroflexota bacterium]